MNLNQINIYGLLFLGGILLTAAMWGRMTRKEGHTDGRLTVIYFAGLVGALIGAKFAFLLAEGWAYRDNWVALLTGRSVTGALLGGYAAVEIAKWKLRYKKTTGDFFAVLVPLALMIGRIGCWVQGCCMGVTCETSSWWTLHDSAGVARWPSQPVEMVFNGVFLVWVFVASQAKWLQGNRFHVYLIAYGLFRFAHEFQRERIEIAGELGGYHFIALALAAFGLWRFLKRRAESVSSSLESSYVQNEH